MKIHLIIEFVVVIITRDNLFRQYTEAVKACVAAWEMLTKSISMTVILVFPEASFGSRID